MMIEWSKICSFPFFPTVLLCAGHHFGLLKSLLQMSNSLSKACFIKQGSSLLFSSPCLSLSFLFSGRQLKCQLIDVQDAAAATLIGAIMAAVPTFDWPLWRLWRFFCVDWIADNFVFCFFVGSKLFVVLHCLCERSIFPTSVVAICLWFAFDWFDQVVSVRRDLSLLSSRFFLSPIPCTHLPVTNWSPCW